ncbi:MAG: AAA family ATPase, partial [Candidatus Calescibacterium sp.]
MNKYLPRLLFDEVIKWLKRREIIAIKGPRQSGKTTLLLMIQDYLIEKERVNPKNVIFLTFEDREILEKF